MVTIYDVAKKAGVSAMTVSRVINNKGRISEATRLRVKQVMEELHYVPNFVARSLVKQESRILSLLITDITNPFFTTVARGAEDAALKHGYKLLFGNSDEDYVKEKGYVDMILSTRVDGVLYAPAGDRSAKHLQMLRQHRIPFVLLDREVPGMACDVVMGDSRDGARSLVDHLIACGHTTIAMINSSDDISTARERLQGYKDALKLQGIPIRDDLILAHDYKTFEDISAIDKLLACPDPPTAIFAANNSIALSVMLLLRERGIHVPRDVSICCFEDIGIASRLYPFLTVVTQPAYEFGAMGIQLLIDRIQGNAGENWRRIVFPSKLLIRESVRTLGK